MQKLKACGEILREERLRQKKSVTEIAKLTRIRSGVLVGMEKGDFSRVSSFATARGLIGNYAKALNLDSEKVLAVFRRDFIVGPRGDVLLKGLAYPLDQPRMVWSPRLTVLIAAVAVSLVFAGYLGYQYWRTNSKPPLEVEEPAAGAVYETNRINVVGKTRSDVQVRINSRTVVVDDEGNFEAELFLPEGRGEVVVEAVNRAGRVNVTRREIEVKGKGEEGSF